MDRPIKAIKRITLKKENKIYNSQYLQAVLFIWTPVCSFRLHHFWPPGWFNWGELWWDRDSHFLILTLLPEAHHTPLYRPFSDINVPDLKEGVLVSCCLSFLPPPVGISFWFVGPKIRKDLNTNKLGKYFLCPHVLSLAFNSRQAFLRTYISSSTSQDIYIGIILPGFCTWAQRTVPQSPSWLTAAGWVG